MIILGIILLAVGIVAMALDRTNPRTRPLSTFVTYVGCGLGAILLVTGIIVYATQGSAIEVDSLGVITVR